LACGREQHGVAVQDGLIGDVLGNGRLPQPATADQDDVGGAVQEIEPHQFADRRSVTLRGPVPIEIGQRLESADMGTAEAAFERTFPEPLR
jgi:hypothetical protein